MSSARIAELSAPDPARGVRIAIGNSAVSVADEIHISKARKPILFSTEGGDGHLLTAIALTGFFVAIAAALQFSSWAERWLTTSAQPKQGASDTPPTAAADPSAAGGDYQAIRAA